MAGQGGSIRIGPIQLDGFTFYGRDHVASWGTSWLSWAITFMDPRHHRGFVRRVGSIPSCRGPSIWILAESSIAGDVGLADIDIPRRSKLIPFEHRALSFYTSRGSCFLAS